MEAALPAVIDLFRRLPPQNVQANLDLLVSVLPELEDELSASIDAPLKVATDIASGGKEYLVCDYNKDGDSFRSPWSNLYDPPFPEDDGRAPLPSTRLLEIQLNEAFQTYREMYYEGGVSSVYLWDVDDSFAGVVLIKKENSTDSTSSSWDSIHVFELSLKGRTALYRVTSTVMLYMTKEVKATNTGSVSLGGSMTRQKEQETAFDSANSNRSHTVNIGKMVEEMEIALRNQLAEVYFSKTQDIVGSIKSNSSQGFAAAEQSKKLQSEMISLLKTKSAPTV